MTPQEQQMLQGLIQRVNQTQLQEKDFDAEEMLQQTLGKNPDALYILAQTVLVQQYALDQAQSQLDQLRQQQPQRSSSFLGNLLGRNEEPARPAPPPPPPPPQYAQPQYVPAPGYAVGYGAPQSGGFLRGAMQTAAGVAAGALAFESIEGLMHGFGHAAGYGPGFGSFGDSDRPEIINNYYGDGNERDHENHLSPDIEDRRGESAFSHAVDSNDHGNNFMDSGDDNSGSYDDDTSSFDDSSDFSDDGGGFDSGGDDNSF
ncbi:DUF2076 domain-containing protein [Edaphobacter albus]|uniref:DUF2076 domain-containing protein n=1 Tax=Edaphobacter sp. 4G125 TaxID=2763071 RepID=UPI001645AB12|nr:DUF2076 domain-containing protein [Edaphobacter sp. 4G125]QNI36105.1 DUF2076 domain-containing protein [Edaphobacter sp. 4G125]